MNLEILDLIGKRLLKGEIKYGHENVISDGRDFIQEALEESLDLAVYVSAKLIEIEKKEKQMGAKIKMENRQDDHDRRLKLLEDAVAELSRELIPKGTRVHHVDAEDIVTTKSKAKKTTKPKVRAEGPLL